MSRTLLDKIWDSHKVASVEGGPDVLYIDAHLIHEVTSPQAFAELKRRNLKVRRPERTFATVDHAIPTRPLEVSQWPPEAALQVQTLAQNCAHHGILYFGLADSRQGIVHVIGPEQGITRPGMTIVCGDSHTSTHGAFGALAFGVGTSEVAHVLATQCLLQDKPKSFAINVRGQLGPGVTAKDLILAIIARNGVSGGSGYVFEYRGPAIRALSMAGRMTVCNMSIEGGARAGMIAADETTWAYLKGRPYAPAETSSEQWVSDEDAVFDRQLDLDATELAPMVSYGTHPGQSLAVTDSIPRPEDLPEGHERQALGQALDYMGLQPGQSLQGQRVDVVFIGSCTNGRLEDLREAAEVVRGRRIRPSVRALVVPGSQKVKAEAEKEGLDDIFRRAGFEWRQAGCSMCLAMNEDKAAPGQYVASTSNRNFRGRQGPGSRTFLMSPSMAAAAALHGCLVDVRKEER